MGKAWLRSTPPTTGRRSCHERQVSSTSAQTSLSAESGGLSTHKRTWEEWKIQRFVHTSSSGGCTGGKSQVVQLLRSVFTCRSESPDNPSHFSAILSKVWRLTPSRLYSAGRITALSCRAWLPRTCHRMRSETTSSLLGLPLLPEVRRGAPTCSPF